MEASNRECQLPRPGYSKTGDMFNYKNFNFNYNFNLLNLAVAKFCPNLRKLYTISKNDELGTLEDIFNNCKYLESIKVWSDYEYSDLKELLEEFFINWKNRIPLSFDLVMQSGEVYEVTEIIEKYKKLGIIKKFEIVGYGYY